MSTINATGQIGHGVGGGYASIDNYGFCPGVWGGWVDDQQLALFANGTGNPKVWVTSLYNHLTGLITPAIADPAHPQYGAGMNHGFAGGGVWAAWFGSDTAQRGLYTSYGLHLPNAALLAVGVDGGVGYKPDYYSEGPTLCLDRDGSEWPISGGTARDLQLLGARRAIWMERNVIQVANLPQPMQIGNVWVPRAHWINGRWWVSYYSDVAGVVLHPFDELVGYRISPPGVDCWFSAREFAGRVRFGLSNHIEEQPGQIRAYVVDTDLDPRIALIPDAVIPPVTRRPFWLGSFMFSPGGMPSNCDLWVRGVPTGVPTRPALVTDETAAVLSGPQIFGHWFSGNTVEAIEAKARTVAYRPIAYWDGPDWPRWPELPEGAITCLQAYCRNGQSIPDFEEQLRRTLQTMPSRPVALVCQQYSTNASLVGYVDPTTPPPYPPSPSLKALIPVFVRLVNEFAQIQALLLFSGVGRPGGLADHPDVRAVWDAIAPQITTPLLTPWVPPVDPVDPPKPPDPIEEEYPLMTEYRLSNVTERGGLLGPGGKFLRVVPHSLGRGLFGGYDLKFDADAPEGDAAFALSQPDTHFTLVSISQNVFLGVDATAFSADMCRQWYTSGGDVTTRGPYESITVARAPGSGLVLVFVDAFRRSPQDDLGFAGGGPLAWVPWK